MPAQAFSATTFTTNPYAPPTASTSQENNTPSSVIPNQPQPFVMPLGPPPMAAPPYTVYPPRYPATSYYQYSTPAAGFYAATPTQNASQPTNTPTNTATTTPPTNHTNPPPVTTTNAATTTPTMTNTNVPNSGTPTQAPANPWPTGYNQVGTSLNDVPHASYSHHPKGQWAEDEVTRLKQLTEQCRDQKGEIDWDRVIQAWGNTRTR